MALDDLLTEELAERVRSWQAAPLPEATDETWLRELRRALLQRRVQALQEEIRQFRLLLLDPQDGGKVDEARLLSLNELRDRLRHVQYVLARTVDPLFNRRQGRL